MVSLSNFDQHKDSMFCVSKQTHKLPLSSSEQSLGHVIADEACVIDSNASNNLFNIVIIYGGNIYCHYLNYQCVFCELYDIFCNFYIRNSENVLTQKKMMMSLLLAMKIYKNTT